MPTTPEEIAAAIRTAVAPGFRDRLLARGEARSMIWRDGVLPDEAPPFSTLLTYDLLSYGYGLLSLSIRLLEVGGGRDVARSGFEHAAGAIEAVASRGDKNEARDFHRIVAAAGYHLGQFSARAYSLLEKEFAQANLSSSEKALGLLMLRDLDGLETLSTTWRLEGRGSDDTISAVIENIAERDFPIHDGDEEDLVSALDLALTDNFMGGMATALVALERGDVGLVESAVARLTVGLEVAAEIHLVPQWWCHRLAIHLLRDLWNSSFHVILPKILPSSDSAEWKNLRDLFIASLFRRSRAEIELWPSQVDAASQAMRVNENLVVSLPTSAGKTRVAELCILACLALGKRVVFVTPLRALSAQTEVILQRTFRPLGKTVSSLYGSIGVSGVDENLLKDRHVVVATPEKLDFALRNDASLIDDVGLVVLDEGHMIGVEEREVRYEAQVQRLLQRPDASERRIVCLSAILPDGDELADFVAWLTRDQAGGLVKKDWRPTRLRFGDVHWYGEHAQLNIQVGEEKPFVPKFLVARIPPKKKRKTPFPCNQRELCLATAWRLAEEGQSVLIFCPERRSVEPLAKHIVDLHGRGLLPSVLVADEALLATAIAIGCEWFSEDHAILQCLRLGVAIHHGALPTPFRKEIERLLRESILRITVSSPTLAQGLNLSASALVMYALTRAGETIPSSEFRNIVGRAGRAYVDVEGLVLYPIFDDHSRRRARWNELLADPKGHRLESGLLRLVVTLLVRMQEKIGSKDLNKLVNYVVNNAAAWSFPVLSHESDQQSDAERARWERFLTSLDTAILSLLGEQEIPLEEVETKLDEVLGLSLWKRRLARRNEETRAVLEAGLISRARYIWSNSTATQRKGYFLAGVGLNTGKLLDKHAATLGQLLLNANAAILASNEEAAIKAIKKFAEVIFSIPPFGPEEVPDKWRKILAAWLRGKPIVGLASGNEDEVLQFIEQALIYRLPWGMEAVRVRAMASGESIGDLSVDDLELTLAVAAVETGTLSVPAAILMRAGFSSRMAAIKAVLDTEATFRDAYGLREWLSSPQLSKLSDSADWPSAESTALWEVFRQSFVPAAQRTWMHHRSDLVVHPENALLNVPDGTPVRLVTPNHEKTLVVSADCQLIGSLIRPLNPKREGLVVADVNADKKSVRVTYLGPNDLFAVGKH